MRGQRTHSNSKNILRFQSYFSSYILTIPRTNFYEYYSSIKEASLEQKLIQEKPKKKKKDKSKSKTTKNKKKIKKDI
jgi:hypothetical protein